MARRAVAAVGIDEGPTVTVLRISRGGPEVIEVAARLGGGHDAELAELVTGIPLTELAIRAALGRPLSPAEVAPAFDPRAGGAALRFLTAPPGSPRVGRAAAGAERGRLHARLPRARPRLPLPPPPSDRAGALLAVGATRDEALARAEAAVERIRFVTAAPPQEAVALADVRTASD